MLDRYDARVIDWHSVAQDSLVHVVGGGADVSDAGWYNGFVNRGGLDP
jgi:hypothetical protein